MKIVFKLLTVAALVMTACGVSAQGFSKFNPGTQLPLLNGGTNKVTALTTNGYINLDIPKAEKLALFVDVKHLNASGAGDTDQIDIQFFRGLDSSRFETNAWFTWVVPTGASTAAASTATNIDVGSIPYLRARFANRSTNAHGTNILFHYGFKN